MLFNSYTFAIFFALVCAVYFLNFSWKYKKIFLLLMSYLFYAAWNAPYLLLIIFSTVIDFFAARRIHATDNRLHRRAWLTLSLAGNLGVLSYFKYGAFALENFTALAARFGVIYEPMPWSILLPVGISFYTFQTLSYSIDIFKGRMKPTNNFLDFALFVTFFPQLVAGPIVRARRFMPQLVKQPVVTLNAFGWGLTLIVIGLFSKMVIADGLVGPVVDRIYAIEGTVPAFTALLGAYGFAIQILCDFSGYSLVAIGVAACLGFTLPENFRAPFAATSYTDLWQRWHISMSSWFRDYLYATIRGDNRSFRHMLKTQMITMTVIGLWHGASWTFVVWGAYNGVIMAAESVLRRYFGGYSLWDTAPVRHVRPSLGHDAEPRCCAGGRLLPGQVRQRRGHGGGRCGAAVPPIYPHQTAGGAGAGSADVGARRSDRGHDPRHRPCQGRDECVHLLPVLRVKAQRVSVLTAMAASAPRPCSNPC